jgi:hypothetical protein
MALKKLDYEQFEKARTLELDQRLQQSLESRSSGKIDSLKHTILSLVSEGQYDHAKSELSRYLEMQSDYPAFKMRTYRHFNHCKDVISAINAKRSLPGLHTLPMSKQQEVMEKVLGHFEELKHYLHKIEIVKIDDLRSTVVVIKAVIYCLFLVVGIHFLRSAAKGILQSFDYIINDYTNNLINWIFDLF